MPGTLTFDLAEDLQEVFLEDSNELLQTMETGILSLEQQPDPETLQEIFRAAHTLKGNAAIIGHRRMVDLTHSVETLFDVLRERVVAPPREIADVLFATVDALKALREEVASREPCAADVGTLVARLVSAAERVAALDVSSQASRGADAEAGVPEVQLTPEQMAQAGEYASMGQTIYQVSVSTVPDAFLAGARLLQVSIALADVGQVIVQSPSQADLADGLEEHHLWLVLATEGTAEAISALLRDITDIGEPQVEPFSLDQAAAREAAAAADIGGDGAASAAIAHGAVNLGADKTVRIGVERLDNLMNLVGELVTDRTRLTQLETILRAQHGKNGTVGSLNELCTHFGRVVDQLQEEVMQTRLLPIATLFAKFPRLVRDLARTTGKQVTFITEGEATEVDRSIVEVIGDTLMHLLRNAVDHGIELPEEREAAGKSPTGTVRLTAAHAEGHIVIGVVDDGRGIDPDRVREAAVRRGIITREEAEQMDDDQAIEMIFRPNLSTAAEVTEVSGRGVGMDVVRSDVERLGGTVVVDTRLGQGTTFRITLPLTLAIVQTMLVALGEDIYAIPLAGIIDALYLADVPVNTVKGVQTITWRGSVVPLLYLRQWFAHPKLGAASGKGVVITVAWAKLRAGLVVDRIIGQQEIVVKSLGPVVGQVQGLSGCTILGDSRIALVVDIPGMVNLALQSKRQESA